MSGQIHHSECLAIRMTSIRLKLLNNANSAHSTALCSRVFQGVHFCNALVYSNYSKRDAVGSQILIVQTFVSCDLFSRGTENSL